MLRHTDTRWDLIERWCPTLFLVGGVLLVGHAAVMGIRAFTELATPPDVFVMAGHLIALVGLLGLSPALVERSPRLVWGATVVAAITLAGWAVMTGVRFLAVVGIAPSLSEVFPGVFFVLVLAAMVLTYALFGVATLRADEQSRIVGLLVLAPGALLLVLIVDSALTGASAVDGVVIGGGLALSMLTLGYSLRTWRRPLNRGAPAGQQPTG